MPTPLRRSWPFFTVVLGNPDPGLAGLQHHAEEDAVVLPPIFDFETQPLVETDAPLKVVNGEARLAGRGSPLPFLLWHPSLEARVLTAQPAGAIATSFLSMPRFCGT